MPNNFWLFLSYFDTILGPSNLHSSSPLIPEEHPDLGRILEFTEEEGNFVFTFRKYQTLNHIFYIESEFARGGKELLMITYMIKAAFFKDEITDVYNYLLSKTSDLESYALELKKFGELTDLLHTHKNNANQNKILDVASEEFKDKFLNLFQKYFEKMTPRIDIKAPLLDKGNLKKIYVFGPHHAGKTEFVRNLEINQFRQYKDNEMKRDLASKIYDFIIDNIEVLTFECIDEHTNAEKMKLYEDCIDDAQGFILIFNAANKELLKETIEMFQLVLNRCLDQGETMPILIIGNKFENKEEITSDMIFENFDLNKLNECGLHPKYFSINILNEDDKIINALRWFLTQII